MIDGVSACGTLSGRRRLEGPRLTAAFVLALLASAAVAGAESVAHSPTGPALKVGDRIRLRGGADGGKTVGSLEGTLTAVDERSLTLAPRGGASGTPRIQFPRASLSSLEVAQGRHGHAVAGALIGMAAGAATGAILGDSGPAVSCPVPPHPCGGSSLKWGYALFGGLVGIPVGALAGHFIRTERWTKVDPRSLKVTVAPPPGGGVGITARFRF